jgi:two-component system, chemotaxis family, chemotaxis protein CheY
MEPDRGPILVVEDDPAMRDALVVALRHEGYATESATDGHQALARLREPAPPALVLLDLMLPVMDGFEFRVQQLQDPALARIPVIVLSGGGDLDRKAASLHADACLGKPLDLEALLLLVATRLGRRQFRRHRRLRRPDRTRGSRGPSARR